MEEIADAGKIKVGVKYDQPGLGFKDAADDIPTGFDVEIAKILVAKLGIDPESRQGRVGGDRSPTTASRSWRGQGRPGPRVVLHHRRAPRDRRPDRPVLGHRPAGAGEGRQRRRGHRRPEGQGGLLGDRLDLDRQRSTRRAPRASASTPTPSASRRCSTARSSGDVHRRHDPAGLRRPERGRAQGRRRAVLRGAHRRRLLQGHPGDVPVDQRRARGGLRRRLAGPTPSS